MGVDDHVENLAVHLPLFACPDSIYDPIIQKDINRYVYCEKFNTPPFRGSYGEQPRKWVDTSFLIRNTLAKREAREIKKRGK